MSLRRLFAFGLVTACGAAAGSTSAPLPTSCDAIEAEYSQLATRTPCSTNADCTDVRSRSLICFWGPVKTNAGSPEGQRLVRLESAFHAQRCSAAPCTPPGGTPVTTCAGGSCATELRP